MSTEISKAEVGAVTEIERFLSGCRHSLPYHHIHWLEAIKLSYGHDYVYLVARESGRIVGIMPICIFRDLTGEKSFCSLPFCDIGGHVSEKEDIGGALIGYALDQLKIENCSLIEIRQRSEKTESVENFTHHKVSMLLKLPDSPDHLIGSFKSKLRSQIKKAEKNGLKFECSSDARSVGEFYSVFSRNMHSLGSPVHSLKWFNTLQSLYENNMLIGKVYYDEEVVGAGVMMISGANVVIPWASTLRRYNRLAPNMLLYWNFLRIACERGCAIFDFGRSTYLEGTYKFKEQWGAEPVLLDWRCLNRDGQALEISSTSSKIRSMVESIWKISPLALANFLGPHLRKHISL